MSSTTVKSSIPRAVGLLLVVFAIMTAKVVWSSRSALTSANGATGEERVTRLGLAARLYAPGNPFPHRALDQLREIAVADPVLSLQAWQTIRSSILTTRSFYTPHPTLLAEANAQIAERMAQAEHPPNVRVLEKTRAWHAARLAQDDAPSVAWSLISLVGLSAWIGFAILFCLRGLDDSERLRRPVAMLCATGISIGLCLFFVGLARA